MKQIQDLLKNKISDYEFQPLFDESEAEDGITGFEFKTLNPDQVMDVQKHEKAIKIEREAAKENSFIIAPIVKEHRGMNRQEELERQRLIQEEVERQLVRIQDQAYKEGFEKGLKDGQEEVYRQMRAEVDQKVEALNGLIEKVLQQQADLLKVEKQNVYRTIKTLTKWIILRELKDDGDYVLRLLDKLISELQVKSNILVQLDPTSFEEMPSVFEALQEKLGELENVRVEIDYDIPGKGVVVESDNGIINGSLQEQFISLSKLFEQVGLKTEEEDLSVPDFPETVTTESSSSETEEIVETEQLEASAEDSIDESQESLKLQESEDLGTTESDEQSENIEDREDTKENEHVDNDDEGEGNES